MKTAARDKGNPEPLSPRWEIIMLVWERAMRREVGMGRMYGFDDDGRTYEIVIASRDSKAFDKNTLKVPPTCKAVCAEGDRTWTKLPDYVPTISHKRDVAAAAREAAIRRKAQKPPDAQSA